MTKSNEELKSYIAKHIYLHSMRKNWDSSGKYLDPEDGRILHCGNFINKGIFKSFQNNVEVWQEIGLEAPFDEDEAMEKLNKITEMNPKNRFRICRLLIRQITTSVKNKEFDNKF